MENHDECGTIKKTGETQKMGRCKKAGGAKDTGEAKRTRLRSTEGERGERQAGPKTRAERKTAWEATDLGNSGQHLQSRRRVGTESGSGRRKAHIS